VKKAINIILRYNLCIGLFIGIYAVSTCIGDRLIQEFLAVSIYIPLILTVPIVFNPMVANFMERTTLLTKKNILYLSAFEFVLQMCIFCVPLFCFYSKHKIRLYLLITLLSVIISTVSFYLSSLLTYRFYDNTQSTSITNRAYFSICRYAVIILCVLLGEPIYDMLFSNGPSYLYLVFKGVVLVLHPTLVSSVFGYNVFRKCETHKEEIFLFGFFWGLCSFSMVAIPNIFSAFKLPILILIIWAIISAFIACVSVLLRNHTNHIKNK